MGALAGTIGISAEGYSDPLGRALTVLAARGPDAGARGEAALGAHPVHLGARRILLDEGQPPGQPLHLPGGGLLVYDGEIHNAKALRTSLEADGHVLAGPGEGAILAGLLEHRGVEGLRDVEGGYAFAWLAGPEGPLLLGRDPLGKRPLVYARRGDTVFFASTLDALLSMHPFQRRADGAVLAGLLRDGRAPGRRTVLENILRVAPGEVVGIHPSLAMVSMRVPEGAWSVHQGLARPLLDVMRLAVQERLDADRPAGIFLSGGIDSALVAALAREISHIPAWSLTFPGHQSVDESQRVRRIGQRLGLEHVLVPCPADPTPWILGAARAFDEPCPDLTAVPLWGLSRAAGRAVRVVLTGLGGDEVLGGHRRYWLFGHGPWMRHVPPFIHDPVESVLSRRDRGGVRQARRGLRPPGPFHGVLRMQPVRLVRSVFGPALASITEPPRRHETWETAVALDELHQRLPPMRMMGQDRAVRAHGLLARHPFLDARVRQATWAIEQVGVQGRGHQKHLLRAFVDEVLDPDMTRLPRMGFAFPIDDLYRGPLRPLAQDALLGKRARERGFISPAGGRRLLRAHTAGSRNHGALIHTLVMLELWSRRVLDGEG